MSYSKMFLEAYGLNDLGHEIILREYVDKGGRLRSYVLFIDGVSYNTTEQVKARKDLEQIMEKEYAEYQKQNDMEAEVNGSK